MTADPSFIQFREGMGGRLVERAWNMPIDSLQSWSQLRSRIINENVDSDGAFFRHARDAEGWLSCGERAVMLAVLSAIGFQGFAEELNGGCRIEIENDISQHHRDAFQLAMSVVVER